MVSLAQSAEWLAAIIAIAALFTPLRKSAGILLLYIIYCTLQDYCSRFAGMRINGGTTSNHYYYNLCYIFEMLLLIGASYAWIGHRKIHLALAVLWVTIAIANIAFGQGLWIMNTYSLIVGYIISSGLAIWHMWKLSNEEQQDNISKTGRYIIWVGILIACLFSMAYRVAKPLTNYDNKVLFNSIIRTAAIIKYTLLAIGIVFLWRHQRIAVQYG